jgi:hypothetical protein
MKNIEDLHRTPKFRLSPARGSHVEDTAHQFLDERMDPNSDTVDGSYRHGKRGPVDPYGAPRKTHFVKVSEEDQHMGQDRSPTARRKRRLSPWTGPRSPP